MTSIKEMEQARQFKPCGPREEHADDAQCLLERLREVGAKGITTGELIREGCCVLRPPNRAGDLRKKGHLIRTIPEGRGVFRYVLVRENPNPTPRRSQRKHAKQTTLTGSGWFAERRPTGLPLFFDATVRP